MENEELIKAAEHHTKITIPSDYHSFIKGANWQAKRMYSEEEVLKLLISCKERFGGSDLYDYVADSKVIGWFEQFKKKGI